MKLSVVVRYAKGHSIQWLKPQINYASLAKMKASSIVLQRTTGRRQSRMTSSCFVLCVTLEDAFILALDASLNWCISLP